MCYAKRGGPRKSENMRDCCCFYKDGTLIKGNGGAGKPHSKERRCKLCPDGQDRVEESTPQEGTEV